MMAGSHRRKRTTWRTLVVTSSTAALTTGGMIAGYGLVVTQVASASSLPVDTSTIFGSPPTSCSVATGGTDPDVPPICWFDFGHYTASPPAPPTEFVASTQGVGSPPMLSANPQSYTEGLPNGDSVSFDLKYVPMLVSTSAGSGILSDPVVNAVSSPVGYSEAAFGNDAYTGISGDPILYSQSTGQYGPSEWEFVLSNIKLSSPGGGSITNFTMVAADGESTNAGESVEFQTNGGSWNQVGSMVPARDRSTLDISALRLDHTCGGNSGYASGDSLAQTFRNLLSSGGKVVSCDGNYGGHVGDLVVSSTFLPAASSTSSSGATITGIDSLTSPSQEQGMAFGIELPAATPVPAPTPTTTPATVTPGLSLTKVEASGSPDPITKAGQTIKYDFNVTNTGNTTLNNLAITDTQSVSGEALTAPVSCPVTSIAAGASVTCSGTYTVTSTDITNGKVTDSATATATTTTGTSVTSNSSTLTIPVAVPTSAPSSVTPTTKTTTTKTVTPTTKSTSTPAPVKLITGPPTPPTTSTSDLPLGLAIAGIGLGGLGYVIIERKRHNGHNHEVA